VSLDSLDDAVRLSVSEACASLTHRGVPYADLREQDLRAELCKVLGVRMPGRVEPERKLVLKSFQGVGGFDILVRDEPGGHPRAVAELKWSYTKRSKVFEALWDAVKLAMAQDEYGIVRGWLIVGAPVEAWEVAECRELFDPGVCGFRRMWEQRLAPPGSNGGETVGEDLLAGGHGNTFTRTPEEFRVERIAEVTLPGQPSWSVRAVAIHPGGSWIERFADAPAFPAKTSQAWLDGHVPSMSAEEFGLLVVWLRLKKWTDAELDTRVFPLRSSDLPGPRTP
jgi:hypothetical protein